MAAIDYLIREVWEDGSETLFVSHVSQYQDYYGEEQSRAWALERAKERWDCMAHVWGAHGTTIIRPKAFEILSSTVYRDRRHFWHPADCISSLVRGVFLIKEEEHYYEYNA